MANIILGNGQVANAIKPYIFDSKVYDKGEWEELEQFEDVETLNITIPYSEQFESIVSNAITVFSPDTLIIHSTVKPSTCNNLGCSYSPVLGRHENNFKIDVLKYKKMFSGAKSDYNTFIKNTKFEVEYIGENTEELEFAKVMSTGYMFWNLIYEKTIFKICNERGYKFNNVYKRWNRNYNNGVKKDWQRPIYTHDDNPLPQGHCLQPNAYLDDNFINDILKQWIDKKGDLHFISV